MDNTNSPINVEADRMLIKELIYNIISNAVKYINGDGIVTFDTILNGSVVKSLLRILV